MSIKKSFPLLIVLLFLSPLLMTSQSIGSDVRILSKEVHDNSENDKFIGYRNSGIYLKQNSDGVIFKSHLHDYPEITVEMFDQKGNLIYEYNEALKKNVDYKISLKDMPKGRYILNFIYEEMLVVCNVHIE